MSTLSVDVTQNGSHKDTEASCTVAEIEEYDFSRLLDKPRNLNMERQRSFDERSLIDMPLGVLSPPTSRLENGSRIMDHFDSMFSPGRRSGLNTPRSPFGFEQHPMVAEAWDALRRTLVFFLGEPVGTIAALDSSEEKLNYDQVFVRDFVPSALAFLMNGEPEIVKNFILKTLRLQSWEKKIDRFQLGEGVMPASFKVLHDPVTNGCLLRAT